MSQQFDPSLSYCLGDSFGPEPEPEPEPEPQQSSQYQKKRNLQASSKGVDKNKSI
jgi:hypothetical protein